MALCSHAGLMINSGLPGPAQRGSLVSITSWAWTSQLIILHLFLAFLLPQESEVKDILSLFLSLSLHLPCTIRICWLTRIDSMIFSISLQQYLPKLTLPAAICTLRLSQLRWGLTESEQNSCTIKKSATVSSYSLQIEVERSYPHYHNKSLKLSFQSSSTPFVGYSLGVYHTLSVVHLSRCSSTYSCLPYYCRNPAQVFSLHWQREVKISTVLRWIF